MQQSPPPVQPAQYHGYMYNNQPPTQSTFPTDPMSYPEKLPFQGSPPMSSPASMDLRASIPYSSTTSEIDSNMRDSAMGASRPLHELGG